MSLCRTSRHRRTLLAVAAVAVVAVTGSLFARSIASAANEGTTYAAVTWVPQSARVTDNGTDCYITLGGSIDAPDEASAKDQLAVLEDQKPIPVGKNGIQQFMILNASRAPGNPSTGSYELSITGAAIMDCAAVRGPQQAVPQAASTPASGNWTRQALGALAGLATYFALTTVLTAGLVAVGIEVGGTAAAIVGVTSLVGCISGAVGTGVGLAVAGESDRIGVGTIAVGCVTGAAGAVTSAVTGLGRLVGTAVRRVATSSAQEVGGIELAQLETEQTGVTWAGVQKIVGGVADRLVGTR